MKNLFFILLTIALCTSAAYVFLNLSGKPACAAVFIIGILTGISIMNLTINVKNEKINSYKRELEKESIVSTENSSRVKVLESKIEVLEKALENALRK